MSLALILLSWLGLQAAAAPFLPGAASVEGRVVDTATGLPIVGATVRFAPTPAMPFQEGPVTVTTDPAGRFTASLERGNTYRISARMDGYYEGFGARDASGPVIRPEDIEAPIAIGLHPASSISGRVTDPDGVAVAGLQVLLLRSLFSVDGNRHVVDTVTTTDESGRYRFSVPPSRNYFVVAGNPHSGEPEQNARGFAWSFYPGVDQPALAAAIDLAPGISYPNAHLTVSEAARRQVTGRVVDTRTGAAPERVRVDLFPALPFVNYGAADVALPQRAVYDPADGTFVFSDVADGQYRLDVNIPRVGLSVDSPAGPSVDPPADPSLAPPPDPASAWKAVSVSGRDLDVGPIEIPGGTSVSGRIVLQAGRSFADAVPAAAPRVVLDAIDLGPYSPPALPDGDGRFELPSEVHGRYRLSVAQLPENFYLERARLNGITLSGNLIDIPRGIASNLEIEINPNGAEIHARFSGEFVEGTYIGVVLLPDPLGVELDFHRRELVFPDSEGSVVLHGVPPGRYQLFAWDLQRPEADPQLSELRQRSADATRIDVAPGEQISLDIALLPD